MIKKIVVYIVLFSFLLVDLPQGVFAAINTTGQLQLVQIAGSTFTTSEELHGGGTGERTYYYNNVVHKVSIRDANGVNGQIQATWTKRDLDWSIPTHHATGDNPIPEIVPKTPITEYYLSKIQVGDSGNLKDVTPANGSNDADWRSVHLAAVPEWDAASLLPGSTQQATAQPMGMFAIGLWFGDPQPGGVTGCDRSHGKQLTVTTTSVVANGNPSYQCVSFPTTASSDILGQYLNKLGAYLNNTALDLGKTQIPISSVKINAADVPDKCKAMVLTKPMTQTEGGKNFIQKLTKDINFAAKSSDEYLSAADDQKFYNEFYATAGSQFPNVHVDYVTYRDQIYQPVQNIVDQLWSPTDGHWITAKGWDVTKFTERLFTGTVMTAATVTGIGGANALLAPDKFMVGKIGAAWTAQKTAVAGATADAEWLAAMNAGGTLEPAAQAAAVEEMAAVSGTGATGGTSAIAAIGGVAQTILVPVGIALFIAGGISAGIEIWKGNKAKLAIQKVYTAMVAKYYIEQHILFHKCIVDNSPKASMTAAGFTQPQLDAELSALHDMSSLEATLISSLNAATNPLLATDTNGCPKISAGGALMGVFSPFNWALCNVMRFIYDGIVWIVGWATDIALKAAGYDDSP